MSKTDRIIVVSGATGQQGGATARHLLEAGWKVRALTRDASKPAAHELEKAGAEVVEADLNNPSSVERALSGAYGVFSVQTFAEEGPEGEYRQGRALADAAKAAGVQHFVYSSVGGADRNTGIPHFESKAGIERYVKSLGLPYTILQPVYFMNNFDSFSAPTPAEDGTLQISMGLPADVPLQLIAVDDIGAFAAIAFDNREHYLGKSIELAGDERTLESITAAISAAIGKPVRYVALPIDAVRQFSDDAAIMFEWFIDRGYEADIPELRRIYPALQNFETFLRQDGWTPERQFAAPQYA